MKEIFQSPGPSVAWDDAAPVAAADVRAAHAQAAPLMVGRLMRALGATSLQPLVTAAIQLGPVPVLLHAWGPAKYGTWLILSAIPSYFALSNLGFGDASGSDMTVRVAAGDKRGALETYQSSWVLLSVVSLILAMLAAVAVWIVPWSHWVKLAGVSSVKASSVILVFGIYILISQQGGIMESGFRCDGHFATGTIFITALRLVEVVVGTVIGVVTGDLTWAALGYLMTRSVAIVVYGFLLHQKSPWLCLGFRYATVSRLKELAAPALGFIALPLATAISIQGFTLMIAAVRGPLAVTAFSTLRTLTRVNFQLMAVISFAIWPELSRAFGEGKIALARKLHRFAFQAGVALSLLTGMALWLAGPVLYRAWLQAAVSLDVHCFHVLILVAIANSLWYNSSVVSMSTNAHQRITLTLVVLSLVSLGVGRVLLKDFGLTGAAIALLFTDVIMVWLVLSSSLRQLQDRFAPFVRSIVAPQLWFELAKTVRKTF